MKISEISKKADWDEALLKSPRRDFYHTWDFHHISRLNGEGEPVLFDVRMPAGGILFPLLARPITGSTLRDLTSVYGYPSPLTYGEIDSEAGQSFWDAFLAYLHQRGYVSLFSRSHPFLTPKVLDEGRYQRCGRVVVIDLDRPEEEQLGEYRTNHKRDIRKLQNLGVACQAGRSAENLADFMRNYEATMRALDAAPYYFFPKTYYQGLLAARSFDTRIYSCTLDEQVICSGMFVFCGEFVQYHLGGTAPGFASLAPTKLMFDSVRRDASREGYRHFCLGGGHCSKEDSLFQFKAGFSSQTRDFFLIKQVINAEEYQRLCEQVPGTSNYFPKYRAPRITPPSAAIAPDRRQETIQASI